MELIAELRRLHINNRGLARRSIELTSYAEVVLAPPRSDSAHPAFSKLFIETELHADLQAILCTRRPRSKTEHTPWLCHLLAAHGVDIEAISYETDRARFIGRGRNLAQPAAMDVEELSGTVGAVLDQLGRSSEARSRYRMALQIQPNDPSVISNMGMSFVLSGDLKTAETYMRSASEQPSADSRVRQNLALVVGLQGRFQEAEQLASQELDPQQAAANLQYLRGMLAQQNSWKQLSSQDMPKKKS